MDEPSASSKTAATADANGTPDPYMTATVAEFLDDLAARTPAPGGGAAAAVTCAMAAGLVEMAASFASATGLEHVRERAHDLRLEVSSLAHADGRAYAVVLEALRMAPGEERTTRLDTAVAGAIACPIHVLRVAAEVATLAADMAETGNRQPGGRRAGGRAPRRGSGPLGGDARPAERQPALEACRRRTPISSGSARSSPGPRARASGRSMRTHAWNASKHVSDRLAGGALRSAWRQATLSQAGASRGEPRREQAPREASSMGLAAGAASGLVVGLLLEWAIGSERLTGHADDPFSIAFGLPVALAIAAGLFGLLVGTAREEPVEDAPVRVRRFRRMGRAAVSKRGQLPGSPVPPAHREHRR